MAADRVYIHLANLKHLERVPGKCTPFHMRLGINIFFHWRKNFRAAWGFLNLIYLYFFGEPEGKVPGNGASLCAARQKATKSVLKMRNEQSVCAESPDTPEMGQRKESTAGGDNSGKIASIRTKDSDSRIKIELRWNGRGIYFVVSICCNSQCLLRGWWGLTIEMLSSKYLRQFF